jgi:hypothetical protein
MLVNLGIGLITLATGIFMKGVSFGFFSFSTVLLFSNLSFLLSPG